MPWGGHDRQCAAPFAHFLALMCFSSFQKISCSECDVFVAVQDLSLWLYSLAVLRITPSPLWCTSFVEASFDKLTAVNTPPQVRPLHCRCTKCTRCQVQHINCWCLLCCESVLDYCRQQPQARLLVAGSMLSR